ncbi:cell surface protein [Myxococcus sp. K15C18031901]|uniref:cell surface protein n=1 Tax=Myxococcus dinghuensis TaxID=2906761 RepID=UPI0020A78D30|nr:cell surface protein [Myxococcus dinghuensis]MCP3100575.1 cell surface protein [Myxococcus dinghuensis]
MNETVFTAFRRGMVLTWLVGLVGCGGDETQQPVVPDSGQEDSGSIKPADPYADEVVQFTPGPGAGFGQDRFPDVVLGPPTGAGLDSGSLDVLSLGKGGSIILRFTDIAVMDGPGVDLLVFENAFLIAGGPAAFTERARVSVSDDGVTWFEFPCEPTNAAGGYPGCAGVKPVTANPANGISATDPAVAGGDGFDLATVGLSRARFVRIVDAGTNGSAGTSAGFDLDGVAVVNGVAL